MRALRGLVAAALLTVLVGCSATGGGSTTTRTASAPEQTPAPSTAGLTKNRPRIIVVIEENHSVDQILGNPDAPAINRIAHQGTSLTEMFATRHPSLPNYIALVSGDTHGITSDCGNCNVDAPTLVDQLNAAGVGWKAYMQGLPAPCSDDVKRAGAYAKKHDPFDYFSSIRDNPASCRHVVPLTDLTTDLANGSLPQFVWITPDLDHDMHGAGEGGDDHTLVAAADSWLGALEQQLVASPAWRQDTRLVVTWDEGAGGQSGGRHSCCGSDAVGGHIPTLIAGPHVPVGSDDHDYDHYALLRSIETAFGLAHLGHAADSTSQDIPVLSRPTS